MPLLFQAEVKALKGAVDKAQEGRNRAKQEVIKVNKEKDDAVQKADTKVEVCVLPSFALHLFQFTIFLFFSCFLNFHHPVICFNGNCKATKRTVMCKQK